MTAREGAAETPDTLQDTGAEQDDTIQSVDPEVESTARAFGWVPKSEWRGAEDRWIPADEFVNYGQKVVPVLRKNLDDARREITALRSEMQEKTEVFNEFVKERATSETRMFTQALEQLKNQRKEARRAGDFDRAEEIDDAIDEMREKGPPKAAAEAKPTADAQRQKAHPDFAPWVAENDWYNSDRVLRSVADGIFNDMRSRGDTRMGRELLDDIARRVKQEMPHKFGRRAQNPVEGDTRGSAQRSGSTGRRGTFSALPQDAKDQFARFAQQPNSGFKDDDASKKRYAEYYFEQES